MKSSAYADDGVDVKEGDNFSRLAGEICRNSFNNSPFVKVLEKGEHFRGHRTFRFQGLLEGWTMTMGADGNGSKGNLNDFALMHGTAGYDLIAMTAMDVTRHGGLPLVMVDVLDVRTLGKAGDEVNESFRQLITGLGEAAKKSNIVLFRGETAELGVCVGSENPNPKAAFNLSGAMLGVAHPDKEITGEGLEPGQVIIALHEKGFGSNGLSAVRKAFKIRFGDEWWINPEAQDSIRQAAEPCALYDNFLNAINGWYDYYDQLKVKMHAIAHITGGGIPGKFGEDILFPRGLSAELDGLFNPASIMKECFKWRDISDKEAYEIWNGGQRVLVVLNEKDAQIFLRLAHKENITAQVCGRIVGTPVNKKPAIQLKSMYTNDTLEFECA